MVPAAHVTLISDLALGTLGFLDNQTPTHLGLRKSWDKQVEGRE